MDQGFIVVFLSNRNDLQNTEKVPLELQEISNIQFEMRGSLTIPCLIKI